MPWDMSSNAPHPAYEIRYHGRVTREDLLRAVAALKALEPQSPLGEYLLLADCRDIEGGHDALDLMETMELLKSEASNLRLREAILVSPRPEQRANAEFWETISLTRGVQVRLFTSPEPALAWLTRAQA